MSDAPQGERRVRYALPVAFVAVLSAGIGLGVLLDRTWLRPAAETKEDPRLLGKWIEEGDRTPVEFKPDGTFEYIRVTTMSMEVNGKPDPNPTRREEKITGQYRWVDKDTIETIEPDLGFWTQGRVVFEGDNRLSLLLTDGKVRRYTRPQ